MYGITNDELAVKLWVPKLKPQIGVLPIIIKANDTPCSDR